MELHYIEPVGEEVDNQNNENLTELRYSQIYFTICLGWFVVSSPKTRNLSEGYESDILKMVWKKTRVACSVDYLMV